jgi:XTP/dITP diphosphohydrolase
MWLGYFVCCITALRRFVFRPGFRFNRRMIRLLIATRNRHKVGEIKTMLGGGFECLTLDDVPGSPAVVEDADTFAGNATKKAVELARWLNSRPVEAEIDYVLADDSGLEVDALNGAPGVHSARFAALDIGTEGNSHDHDNNAKLLRLLQDVTLPQRTARFRCVLALVKLGRADGENLKAKHFDGVCEGRIEFAALGAGGFGYDPLFVPQGYDQSFAELGAEIKNQISHRARALAKLKSAWPAS